MTEHWPFIGSHHIPMSRLRGEVAVLCYFAVTSTDACHLGGSQMAGASFSYYCPCEAALDGGWRWWRNRTPGTVPVQLPPRCSLPSDGACGRLSRSPVRHCGAEIQLRSASLCTCNWMHGVSIHLSKCAWLKPVFRLSVGTVISRFHYSVLTDICPLK